VVYTHRDAYLIPQGTGHLVTIPAQLRIADLRPVSVHHRDLAGEGPARPARKLSGDSGT
jgi:hypothetical protein